jgi:hypothetical protein
MQFFEHDLIVQKQGGLGDFQLKPAGLQTCGSQSAERGREG